MKLKELFKPLKKAKDPGKTARAFEELSRKTGKKSGFRGDSGFKK